MAPTSQAYCNNRTREPLRGGQSHPILQLSELGFREVSNLPKATQPQWQSRKLMPEPTSLSSELH